MKIFVAVKTGAKKESIEKIAEGVFRVEVRARPVQGKANQAIIKVLAKYFGVAQSRVVIIKGQKAKGKTIEII